MFGCFRPLKHTCSVLGFIHTIILRYRQFGFGAFEIGIMLLTHADRLQNYDDLWIDCAGDEYSFEADGRFPLAPIFRFRGGVLGFDTRVVAYAHDHYGSSSGFSPQ